MTKEARAIRGRLLRLLRDEPVPSTPCAETAALWYGEEYLDLERLDQGVQRVHEPARTAAGVLPRRAVHVDIWRKLVNKLPRPEGSLT